MAFDVGDRVVYPHHGAAVIVKREKRKIDGQNTEYLVLQMAHGELTLRVPVEKADDVGMAVKSLLQMMGSALAGGERIEVRGFGSFSLHYRPPRTGRNPKTGDTVALPGKHVPHFKPGKELRERVTSVAPLPAED